MRSAQVTSSRTQPGKITEDLDPDWAPGLLSDRKLWELKSALDRLKRLGISFAAVDFSPETQARLREPRGH